MFSSFIHREFLSCWAECLQWNSFTIYVTEKKTFDLVSNIVHVVFFISNLLRYWKLCLTKVIIRMVTKGLSRLKCRWFWASFEHNTELISWIIVSKQLLIYTCSKYETTLVFICVFVQYSLSFSFVFWFLPVPEGNAWLFSCEALHYVIQLVANNVFVI